MRSVGPPPARSPSAPRTHPTLRKCKRMIRRLRIPTLLLPLLLCLQAAPQSGSFHFVILGDRTGEPQPGVYEQVWKELYAVHPEFVLSVGDTIQGLNDATAESEWRQIDRILEPFLRIPLYLAAGNHDIWSPASERLYLQHSAHPLHYSFDYRQAHFVILDNSRSDDLPAEELAFLEKDLQLHAQQSLKFIVSHRPSWIVNVALQNRNFPLHQIAKRYGVQYVIAGHIHQILHLELEGVTYVSMPSAGGHLRLSGKYEDGWFFGHARLDVTGAAVDFQIREAAEPNGQARITKLKDWGMAGLVNKPARAK